MSDASLRGQMRLLAGRLHKLEQDSKRRRQPSLGFSSIDDGYLTVTKEESISLIIGQQYDGTNAVNSTNGPTPPQPTLPLVTPVVGGLKVYWDGTFVGGAVAPLDFSKVIAYVLPMSAFSSPNPLDQAVIAGEFTAALGGEITVALDTAEEQVAYLVAWSQAGVFSPASDIAFGTPLPVKAVTTDPSPGIYDVRTTIVDGQIRFESDAAGVGGGFSGDPDAKKVWMGSGSDLENPGPQVAVFSTTSDVGAVVDGGTDGSVTVRAPNDDVASIHLLGGVYIGQDETVTGGMNQRFRGMTAVSYNSTTNASGISWLTHNHIGQMSNVAKIRAFFMGANAYNAYIPMRVPTQDTADELAFAWYNRTTGAIAGNGVSVGGEFLIVATDG